MASSNVTTYGDISPATAGTARAIMLKRGQHLLVTERYGSVDPVQKNTGNTVAWSRYNALARATAPLAEGVPPPGQKVTKTDITAVLEEYGDVIKLTNRIQDFHTDPVLRQYMELTGQQAAETIEEIRINRLKAGTNVFYAANVASRSTVNSPPTRGDFRRIYRYFKKYKARELTSIIPPTAMISTEPIPPSYFVLGHTDLYADISNVSGFIPVQNYSSAIKAHPGEVGSIEQFRIVLTAMFDPWYTAGASGTTYLSGGVEVSVAASADVYPLIFIAKDGYSIVPFQGKNAVKPMVRNPGNPTIGNELGQVGFVSWVMYQAAAITNQSWIARLECAATADPS